MENPECVHLMGDTTALSVMKMMSITFQPSSFITGTSGNTSVSGCSHVNNYTLTFWLTLRIYIKLY